MTYSNVLTDQDRDAIMFEMVLPQLVAYRDSLPQDVPAISAVIALLRMLQSNRQED
ncbi:hypothetical protein [Gluconobacter albidus]|uniref:hypothetical protein n=1 Tax=Gluconobacter albidus TaxID=318683 RepID=UPI001428AB29|nr:hypothetical protein [Gluconobacter albidus]